MACGGGSHLYIIIIIIIIIITTTPSRYMENWKYLPLDLDVTNISISYKKKVGFSNEILDVGKSKKYIHTYLYILSPLLMDGKFYNLVTVLTYQKAYIT